MKKTIIYSILLIFSQLCTAQSNTIITGKVIDKTSGEELIGASVYIPITSNGSVTDFEGNFTLFNIESGMQTIVCQYISYQSDTLNIEIKNDTTINFSLTPETFTLGDINLVTKQDRKDEAYVVNVQKKSAGLINTLSKKQMSITGSSNAADAVKNVSGVTVQGGKYVYVRGLSDRYSLARLNGISLPGLDPNRNSVQMDLIPSNIIDNILVFKTFTPDLPGDFTGGMVDIFTTDFPDSLEIQFNYSTGFSQLSNLNDNFLGQEKSSTDWLGYDDGKRDIPDFVSNNSINFYNPGSFAQAYAYAQSQDESIANLTYNEFLTLNSKWEWLELSRIFLNDSLSMATQSFSKDWDPIRFKSGLNQSLSFSIGNKYEVGKKSLGFNSGISYKRKFNFYEGAEVGQYIQTGEGSNVLTPQKIGLETRGDETVFASLFGNISLHLNEDHKLKVMSMLNQNGQSSARYFDGENMSDAFGLYEEQRTQRYLERQLKTIQLSGEHNFNSIKKSEIKWNLGFTKATQNTPDLKVFVNSYEFPEVEDEETGDFFLDTVPTFSIQTNLYPGPTRYFRFLEEDNFNFKTDYKLDFNEEEFLKIGFSFLEKNRSREEYRYTIDASGINYNNGINNYFNDNNMIVGQSSTGMNGTPMYLFAIDNTEIRNQYNASQKILGSYIMTTLKPIELLECTFGVRYENTDILAESADKSADVGVLKNSDFLPAMSAKYNLDESTKIRISYSKTLARPSFREISPTNWYDFQTALTFVGNPNLKRSLINNIDMRFEKYLSGAGLISLSGFYKKFNNPIEQVMNPQAQNTELSWRNVDEATVLGIEFEYKKKIILDEGEYLNIGFNGSIIHSETEIDSLELILIRSFDPNHASTRPMYGQSPYIVNFYSQYQKLGWNVGASYNVSGESIVIIQKGAVDVYQAPRPQLNIQVGRKFSEHVNLSLSAKNLLSAKTKWYYPFKGEEYIFRSYFYRPELSFSLRVSL